MTKGFPWWLLLAALLALGLRSVQLGSRPMHNDEAVNALKIRDLWEGPGYRYDPNEFHGPTLAYSTLLWEKLTLAGDFSRFTEIRLRSLTVLFGVGLVLLLFLVSDGLGRNATLAAALFTAVSPVLVYYSRDYIHETLFVFFIFLALAAGWRYSQSGKIAWILLAGAAIGLTQATKETFVFNLAAVMGALLLNECFPHAAPASAPKKNLFCAAHLVAAGLVWMAVAVVLFSSFFSNPSGPRDAAGTYLIWFQRAKGASPHVHGWSFYWERLLFFHRPGGPIWSEALILLLAVWGGIAAFARRGLPGGSAALVRFLVFYTAILALIYTVLPYKTPWSALGFWHGAVLLAGVGVAALLAWLPGPRLKITAGIVVLTGAAQLACQAWQSAVAYAADPSNPWVYAQTSPDLLNLVDKVDAVAQASPQGRGVYINVIAPGDDYWPLPWYLRTYSGVGYPENVPGYSKFALDEIQDADAFVRRVKAKSDAVSQFLLEAGLGSDMDAAHLARAGTNLLQSILVTNLNKIITGPSIYDSNRFQGVHLRPATEELRRQNPHGQDLTRLNRKLLEDAYPKELGTNNMPVEPYPPMTIISTQLEPDMDEDKAGIMTHIYELRPNVFLELYVQSNLWAAYLKNRAK
ncbi:MAG: flippase activity-associated protein Agl23 [Verrucomicrobiota bacterium]|jgi:uncharacterized protein (TIGR03663 family)